MSDYLRELPFPRGNTYSQGGLVTLDDTIRSDLEGKLVKCEDTVHGTGEEITLRIVKNDTGSAITVARKFGEFSVASVTDYGARMGTFPCNTAGAVVKPIDDAYAVGFTIPDDDLFYVVEEGLCYCTTEASSVSLSAGVAVASDASGLVNGAACAAGEYPVGTIQEASSATGATVTVRINGGLVKPPAAG